MPRPLFVRNSDDTTVLRSTFAMDDTELQDEVKLLREFCCLLDESIESRFGPEVADSLLEEAYAALAYRVMTVPYK